MPSPQNHPTTTFSKRLTPAQRAKAKSLMDTPAKRKQLLEKAKKRTDDTFELAPDMATEVEDFGVKKVP